MKIIKHSRDNREVTCSACRCVFEFEDEDLKPIPNILSILGVDNDDTTSEYVNCPECGNVIVISRPRAKNRIEEDSYTLEVFSDAE